MTHDAQCTDPVLLDTYLAKCFRGMMDRSSRASQPPLSTMIQLIEDQEDLPYHYAEILENEFWDLL